MRGVIGQTVASGEVLSARIFVIGGVLSVRLSASGTVNCCVRYVLGFH